MKIAFVANSYLDPRTPNSWSGLPYFMRRALESAGVEVETCVMREPYRAASMLRYAYWRFVRGKRYLRSCESRVLRRYGAELGNRLKSMGVDAVFSPSSWMISYLRSPLPTVFWTDAGFAGMLNFYDSFTNLAECSLTDAHAAEHAALRKCARAIYSSEWAATSVRKNYSADPSKIRIVPFGANVEDPPPKAEMDSIIARRDSRRCNLLLIGVDWRRKGADIAVEAATCLNERGLGASLTVMGCRPPSSESLPSFVKLVPFVNKETAEGRSRFAEICGRSHFMIMPTNADCTPVAIAEANYYGLPCLATDVGGIASIVTHEVNGRLFDVRARGAAYADYILGVMRDRDRYRNFASCAAEFARRHFSWEVSGARVAAILKEVVAIRLPAHARMPAEAGKER